MPRAGESLSQHFGLRRQSEAATALFRAGVILERRERQVIRDSREAELSKAVWRCASHRTPKCPLHQATAMRESTDGSISKISRQSGSGMNHAQR
jgi:hypothetical protein